MDEEITAMSQISEALEPLSGDARTRVLQWASDRYDVVLKKSAKSSSSSQSQAVHIDGNGEEKDDDKPFDSFADLYVTASPSSSAEKVLVAAYWHQVINGASDFFSGGLNKDLKDLGHAVSDISKRFATLMNETPQLAIQVKKGGNTKQAKKKYKLTHAGITKVKIMIDSE